MPCFFSFLLPHWVSYDFRKKKFAILVSEYSEWSKTSRNMIISWRPNVWVCMCVCTRLSNFQTTIIHKRLKIFSRKWVPNLRFCGTSNFLKNVCGSPNFCKIWATVKMHTTTTTNKKWNPVITNFKGPSKSVRYIRLFAISILNEGYVIYF